MKSVVVEIKDGFAAILSDDGSIMKIKNKNYSIGDEIIMKHKKLPITKKLVLSIASIMLFLFAGATGTFAYYSPYSYVSLDVNPSIEYTLNRFNRVIKVHPVNEDGQEILNTIGSLNNLTIETAISQTVEEIKEKGYFSNETSSIDTSSDVNVVPTNQTDTDTTNTQDSLAGGIVIAVSAENDDTSAHLADLLDETVANIVEDDVEIEVSRVGFQRVQEAKALGVTPGKLNLVEKLIASSSNADEIDLEEWLNKPVKAIMSEINNNKTKKEKTMNEADTPQIETTISEDSDETSQDETKHNSDIQSEKENKVQKEDKAQEQNKAQEDNKQNSEIQGEKENKAQEQNKQNSEIQGEKENKDQEQNKQNSEIQGEKENKDQEQNKQNSEIEREKENNAQKGTKQNPKK